MRYCLKSYHIIKPVRLIVHQIRKGDILEVIDNQFIQSAP